MTSMIHKHICRHKISANKLHTSVQEPFTSHPPKNPCQRAQQSVKEPYTPSKSPTHHIRQRTHVKEPLQSVMCWVDLSPEHHFRPRAHFKEPYSPSKSPKQHIRQRVLHITNEIPYLRLWSHYELWPRS